MRTATQKALCVLHNSAARGGAIAAGLYAPGAIPTVIAMHLVATGRAQWQQVALGTELLSERQAPASAAAEPAAVAPELIDPDQPEA